MLKWKCHEYGQAIRTAGTIVTFCNCISSDEIELLIKLVKAEAKNANV